MKTDAVKVEGQRWLEEGETLMDLEYVAKEFGL
jgi:hypothetical protein